MYSSEYRTRCGKNKSIIKSNQRILLEMPAVVVGPTIIRTWRPKKLNYFWSLSNPPRSWTIIPHPPPKWILLLLIPITKPTTLLRPHRPHPRGSIYHPIRVLLGVVALMAAAAAVAAVLGIPTLTRRWRLLSYRSLISTRIKPDTSIPWRGN